MILAYHRIAIARSDPFDLCVAPAVFRDHMRYIRERCLPVSLGQLADFVRSGRIPSRAVAVTFDDGYVDNLTVASVILEEFGIPATFFVTTARLAETHEFWWDTLAAVMQDESLLPRALDIPLGTGCRLPLDSPVERRGALRSLHGMIRTLPFAEREAVLQSVLTQVPSAKRLRGARPLLEAEIQELAARAGHDIGAHTVHHLSLPAQPAVVKREEMVTCKEQLEALLNRPVSAFSYPFGDIDTQTLDIARSAGFDVGVTTAGKRPDPGCDSLMLPRIVVRARTFADETNWM